MLGVSEKRSSLGERRQMYLGGEEQWHQAKGLYHHLHHITLREKPLEHIQHRTLQTHHCCLVTTVDHLNLVQILYLTESWAKRQSPHFKSQEVDANIRV